MYEFTNAENAVIGKLAGRLRLAGVLQTVIGVLMLVGFATRTIALRTHNPVLDFGVDVPVAIATIAAGVLLAFASPPFFAIVRTQGQDVDHVMNACGKLSAIMTLILVVFALGMVVWLGVFVWLLVAGTPFIVTEPIN